jgi:hypothetical protein
VPSSVPGGVALAGGGEDHLAHGHGWWRACRGRAPRPSTGSTARVAGNLVGAAPARRSIEPLYAPRMVTTLLVRLATSGRCQRRTRDQPGPSGRVAQFIAEYLLGPFGEIRASTQRTEPRRTAPWAGVPSGQFPQQLNCPGHGVVVKLIDQVMQLVARSGHDLRLRGSLPRAGWSGAFSCPGRCRAGRRRLAASGAWTRRAGSGRSTSAQSPVTRHG